MASISIRDVEKRYGAAAETVIHRLSVEIADGEFVVIVGPSGCGKSTLLRMVAGLEEISAGEIAIGGRVVNDVEPAARDIAMVFQNYALYPHMSVRRNIAYGLSIARRPKAEIEDRVRRVAETLELTPLLERKPRALSGGQRQRVAMARAIVREPKAFLFDEPLSNLDARLRAQARVEIRRLHAELGVTSLFVTHDQVEAMTLAERMIVMNEGRIEQIGTPEAVYRRPATRFVAGFIGSPAMNLMDGRVAGGRFEIGGASLALPDAAPSAGPAILGWRAENVTVDTTAAGNGWPLRVEAIELLGAERLLHGRLGDASVVARIDAALPPPSAGDLVSLDPIAGRLHWFDMESGRRLEG